MHNGEHQEITLDYVDLNEKEKGVLNILFETSKFNSLVGYLLDCGVMAVENGTYVIGAEQVKRLKPRWKAPPSEHAEHFYIGLLKLVLFVYPADPVWEPEYVTNPNLIFIFPCC
jgi:hypothetical protein